MANLQKTGGSQKTPTRGVAAKFNRKESEVHISKGILALLAILSIGGLVLLGYEAKIVGDVGAAPYVACCTVETWTQSPMGFAQGGAVTGSAVCYADETLTKCCWRTFSSKGIPVRVLGAVPGQCSGAPEMNYPIWIR